MEKKKDINTIYEQKIITRCILKGMTLTQIAQELKCAKSTAGYKTKKLFEEYSSCDRYEFVINVFTKLITKYKNEIAKLQEELENYKK
ncbi:MAG: hypothetical protein IJ877_07130 [Candidatus Gastranaerophilales bacterium]|nr:hypothetical protein [Candidatus Gastranaerophilales bacterium]